MGVSAKQYIQNKVISEGWDLLIQTAPISDIAFELHFQRFLILSAASAAYGETPCFTVKSINRKSTIFPFFIASALLNILTFCINK